LDVSLRVIPVGATVRVVRQVHHERVNTRSSFLYASRSRRSQSTIAVDTRLHAQHHLLCKVLHVQLQLRATEYCDSLDGVYQHRYVPPWT